MTIHQRYRHTDGQTNRRTDRQTTCDGNTALCTKVHLAVKIDFVSYSDRQTYGQFLRATAYMLEGRNPHRRTSWKLVGNPGHELEAN